MTITIDKFAKGQKGNDETNKNAVIYTRVSSKEQASGYSLKVQLEGCMKYAKERKYNVLKQFGGTNESAKSDINRKQFDAMLKYVKDKKNKIGTIIVYKTDRFSRTGDGAMAIISQLKKQGVYVHSVTENYDPTEPSGEFMQSLFASVGKFENSNRTRDTVEGMLKRLASGLPCGPSPVGYISDRYTKPKGLIHTKDAPLVKKGFELYAEGHSLQEVSRKVGLLGLSKNSKRWNEILQNPLYAGYVRHNLLGDRIIKGNFEAIVSEELFLKVNKLRAQENRLFIKKKDETGLPLKKFLVCTCGTPFTGYQASKKLKVKPFYYKCNATGCGKNISAKKLHESFLGFLRDFQLSEDLFGLLKAQLKYTFENQNKEAIENQKVIQKKLDEVKNKQDELVEKLLSGTVNDDTYRRFDEKLRKEQEQLTEKASQALENLSNPEEFIDSALAIASNMAIRGLFSQNQTTGTSLSQRSRV